MEKKLNKKQLKLLKLVKPEMDIAVEALFQDFKKRFIDPLEVKTKTLDGNPA